MDIYDRLTKISTQVYKLNEFLKINYLDQNLRLEKLAKGYKCVNIKDSLHGLPVPTYNKEEYDKIISELIESYNELNKSNLNIFAGKEAIICKVFEITELEYFTIQKLIGYLSSEISGLSILEYDLLQTSVYDGPYNRREIKNIENKIDTNLQHQLDNLKKILAFKKILVKRYTLRERFYKKALSNKKRQ